MAKYSAPPGYRIDTGKAIIKFDHKGEFETTDESQIAVLDGLAPTWVTKLDDSDAKPTNKRAAAAK